MTDRIVEENIETITEMTVMIGAGTGLGKGNFPEAITTIGIGVQAIVGPGQDQEQVQIEIEYNVISVREYNHFVKDCPTSREEKEIEQLQQMLNLGNEQTSLKSLITGMQDNFSRASSEENLRPGLLNL